MPVYLCRAFFSTLLLSCFSSSLFGDWPQWRGPHGDGSSDEKGLPTHWSPSENIAWKVSLPEPGNSTPVVWGNRIFLTQPLAAENRRTLMCFDRTNGKLLWQVGTEWIKADPTHKTNPLCSSSPVTDGERVIAWFGSAGLFCFDMDGNELWKLDLGEQKHIWGYGSSPVIHDNFCYLNFGPGERSFLIAVDCKTGQIVWRHDEPINIKGTAEAAFSNADFYGSWSTPVFRNVAGRDQLLMSFPFRLCSFDPLTGNELWTTDGLNALVYTSPLVSGDVIVAMGGYSGMAMAITADAAAQGNLSPKNRLWHHPKTKQRIGSGVIHQGHIYIHNDPGIVECFELASGKLVWEKRLAGANATNWSSVLLADGYCYTITQGGDCHVFRASPEFDSVAMNSLGESSNSSIVASHGQLLIRTHEHLWCVGK